MKEDMDNIDLTSNEKLSLEWPDEFPGITRFPNLESTANLQFDSGDIILVNRLANLAPGALIDEMKALKTISCLLSAEEEQEKARGKILRVLLD